MLTYVNKEPVTHNQIKLAPTEWVWVATDARCLVMYRRITWGSNDGKIT